MRAGQLSVHEMTYTGFFAVLIAVGAFIKITIPIQPFPMHFTLQFFFVLLSGFLLGGRLGGLSVCTYLLIGLAGVPIFAEGGGLAYLVRPTFGFLIGFAAAAWVTGTLSRRIPGNSMKGLVFAAFWGMMAMYVCGAVYFYVVSNYVIHMTVGWRVVLVNCFLLTVGGDFVLCVLASWAARRLRMEGLGLGG